MRPAELARIEAETIRAISLLRAAGGVWQLATTISAQRTGFPAGGYDVGGGTADSSSTERAALAPDPAARALHDLDVAMGQLRTAMSTLGFLQANWLAEPRVAACAHCGESTGDRQRTHCRRCTEFVSRHGRFPTVEEMIAPAISGRKGGQARAEKLTPEQRSKIARNAAIARWSGGVKVVA